MSVAVEGQFQALCEHIYSVKLMIASHVDECCVSDVLGSVRFYGIISWLSLALYADELYDGWVLTEQKALALMTNFYVNKEIINEVFNLAEASDYTPSK